MQRTNQGGSILSFIIIGGVMVLLLIGGAYVIRHTLKPAANEGTPVAQKDESSSSSNDKQDKATSDNDTPKEDTTPKTDEKTDTTTPDQTETSTPSSENAAPEEHVLPTTGPSNALMSGMMFSTLVAVMTLYLRSRRERTSL